MRYPPSRTKNHNVDKTTAPADLRATAQRPPLASLPGFAGHPNDAAPHRRGNAQGHRTGTHRTQSSERFPWSECIPGSRSRGRKHRSCQSDSLGRSDHQGPHPTSQPVPRSNPWCLPAARRKHRSRARTPHRAGNPEPFVSPPRPREGATKRPRVSRGLRAAWGVPRPKAAPLQAP